MVQILPLVGAAALLAQAALGAVVPVRRTNHENQYNNNENNYNVGQYQQNQYNNNNNYENNYQQQQQEANNYYQGNQDSNQDGRGHETTTVAEMVHETTTAMRHETTTVEEQQAETTTMEHETTTVEEQAQETSTMMHDTTTVEEQQMEHETTTVEEQAQETSTYTYPQYGSGSNQYNNNGYNDCVAQCMAQFGAPPSTMTMEHQQAQETATGAIHTVMVAPTGVGLRYVPFAVNASVGDTIRYVWTTPNNHTVTLSSALTVCNKSAQADSLNFASGVRNAAVEQQTFDVVVETAEPQFYYCSVAQHCQKGMFGIINPASNIGAANTVGTLMTSMMQDNPQMQAAYQYLKANITDQAALGWGMNMVTEGIPEDQWENVATNVLITQAMFGENPGMLEYGHGAATPDGSPIQMMGDFNVLLSANTGTAPTTGLVVSSTADAAATSTPSLTPVNATSGALTGKSAASVWVAAFVGVVGFLLF